MPFTVTKKMFLSLPARQEILQEIQKLKDTLKPEDIFKMLVRTHEIKGQARQEVRQLLKDAFFLNSEQQKRGRRQHSHRETDSSIVTFQIADINPEGDIFGVEVDHDGQEVHKRNQGLAEPTEGRLKPVNSVLLAFSQAEKDLHHLQNRLQIGDRIIAKVEEKKLKFLRKIDKSDFILGVFHSTERGHYVTPTSRKVREDFYVSEADRGDAKDGDLVEISPVSKMFYTPHSWAKVTKNLGSVLESKSMSLIAIHSHDLPTAFPDQALELAQQAQKPELGDREDLRAIPLVTIDDEDARDFDDAIWVEPDPHPPGGWHLIVAIADVSHYVHPQDALDQEALKRGNSIYFPDRVVPMLPEALSNDLCSLRPQEDRACLAVHLWISCTGRLLKHRFTRALMRSAERLTYSEVQAAYKGQETRLSREFKRAVIFPLYKAYSALCAARLKRAPLDLDLPEQRIYLNEQGKIDRIVPRARLDSHRLIEEFMILANVAAAIELDAKKSLAMYRVHDEPTDEKLESLSGFLKSVKVNLPKGKSLMANLFNRIIEKAASTPYKHAINTLVLRTQSQAIYTPDNIGHFGLNLPQYVHFTSPIRRYADLLVHRALVATLDSTQTPTFSYTYEDFQEIGDHISMTERRAAIAERETTDRYMAAYLSQDHHQIFQARIVNITDFAIFLRLAESGADGMIPLRLLRHDYFVYDPTRHCLQGRRTRQTYALGDAIKVKLSKADPLRGSLMFEVVRDP